MGRVLTYISPPSSAIASPVRDAPGPDRAGVDLVAEQLVLQGGHLASADKARLRSLASTVQGGDLDPERMRVLVREAAADPPDTAKAVSDPAVTAAVARLTMVLFMEFS